MFYLSFSGLRPEHWAPVYSATKHGVVGYCRSFAVGKHFLPPASEGWGKIMFSVCSHLGGGGVSPAGGGGFRSVQPVGGGGGGSGPASRGGGGQVQPAGGGQVQPAGGGSGPASRGGGSGPASKGGGSASCALLRAVCLLRSRRRTFLLLVFLFALFIIGSSKRFLFQKFNPLCDKYFQLTSSDIL